MDFPSNTKKKRHRRQTGQICLLVFGLLLISTGISTLVFFEAIYDLILVHALRFTPTSQAYHEWLTNDPPLDLDIFLFNWTNPKQINNRSIKPEFKQVGPYRFKEVKEKINISWHEENSTVSFSHMKFYYFDEKNSARNLSDVITTINVVPLTIGYKTRLFNWFTKRMVSTALSSISSLHVTKNVSEILFEGYEEPILGTLSKLPFLNIMDKFGIFYGKNATIGKEGIYSMYYKNDENFGKVLTWNYKNQTDYYEGKCNDIKGSAGEFYPTNMKKDKLVVYSSELCKYAELEYVEEVVIKGVRGYKYTGDYIFDNGTKRPENKCFCKGECIPSGVFNVSKCRDNSPSFLSFPHFYGADPYYTRSMKGMKPDKNKHELYFIIEPKSGVVMEVQTAMQVNMLLQPIPSIRLYEKVPRVFVPLFYFTQKIHLKDDIASSLRLIQNLPEYSNYSSYILLSLGSVFVLWALCSCYCCKAQKQTFHLNGQTSKIHDEVPLRNRK